MSNWIVAQRFLKPIRSFPKIWGSPEYHSGIVRHTTPISKPYSPTTVNSPPSLRPNTSGKYNCSAWVGMTRYSPGVEARIV